MEEIWKDIPEFPNYKLSILGILKHKETILKRISKYGKEYNYRKKELIITPSSNKSGLQYANLYNGSEIKRFVIHDLMVKLFLPDNGGWDTLIHVDGNLKNNSLNNLKWGGNRLQLPHEVWRDVIGYEGLYQVSSIGRVKSLNYDGTGYEKIMSLQPNHAGYLTVILWKGFKRKGFFAHRLVAEAFIPNPMNCPEVNHIDFDTTNNLLENLEWCTPLENRHHSIRHGRLDNRGEKSGSAKLTEEQARGIVALIRENHYTMAEIGEMYGVCVTTISWINTGRNWSHLSDTYPIRFYRESKKKKLDMKNG